MRPSRVKLQFSERSLARRLLTDNNGGGYACFVRARARVPHTSGALACRLGMQRPLVGVAADAMSFGLVNRRYFIASFRVHVPDERARTAYGCMGAVHGANDGRPFSPVCTSPVLASFCGRTIQTSPLNRTKTERPRFLPRFSSDFFVRSWKNNRNGGET